MKRTTKDIIFLIVVSAMLFGAYHLGTTQAQVETKETIKTVEVIPEGYISINDCIPLEDIACWYVDNYDYPCFSLKDVGYQLDDVNYRSYTDICGSLEDITEEYRENYIDLRTVTGFKVDGDNLWIYTDDGNSYLIEK